MAQREPKPPSWVDLLYAEPAAERMEPADAAGDGSTRLCDAFRMKTERINTDSDRQDLLDIVGISTASSHIPKVVRFFSGSDLDWNITDLLPVNLLDFNKYCIVNAYCFITFS